MDIVEMFIIIVPNIGVQGQRRQTTTYISHRVHKKGDTSTLQGQIL